MILRPQSLGRRGFLAIAGAALLSGRTPALSSNAPPIRRLYGVAFGTGWRVSLKDDARVTGLKDHLNRSLQAVDLAFSPWRGDSIVGRFNAGGTDEVMVSDEVAGVVGRALDIAGESGGIFDPTIGPMVSHWGFGPIGRGETPPDGWRRIRAGNGYIARDISGLTLDLCGIAKGHALDRMVADLLDTGHRDFLVEIGGELAARGHHPSGRAWQVGIENPLAGVDGVEAVLTLDGMAVATSGDRANAYDIGGRRYNHIIDTETREPVSGALASVSVVMPSAIDADGWATALMAAGDRGLALARRLDIAALFLSREGAGLRWSTTGRFERFLV